MTIDEAIAHAKEVAKEKRKEMQCKTCKLFAKSDLHPLQGYCRKNKFRSIEIDSWRKVCSEYVPKEMCKCAEEHEQLAAWLEELKAYREIGTVEEYKNAIDWREEEYGEEYNEDIIYEMNCPKCNYDMFEIYDRVCKGGKSKYCKITNIHSGSCGVFYGTDWDVECTCPKCKTKFTFSDEDYETFGLKFNDGLSVKE